MTPSQRLNRARDTFHAYLHQQASHAPADVERAENEVEEPEIAGRICSRSETTDVRETVVIRDGFYVGRRFHSERHSGLWFAEEDELKIFAGDGAVLESFQFDRQDRIAA